MQLTAAIQYYYRHGHMVPLDTTKRLIIVEQVIITIHATN
jgi:hypothetical protein